MASINTMRRERRRAFQNLKQAMRKVDVSQEKVERLINRVLARKLNVPETKDVARVLSLSNGSIGLFRDFVGLCEQIEKDFF